jgi:hypothetical protein
VVIWRNTVPAGVFLATELAKVGVPLNSIWLQNLAKKGSEFFSVAKRITSKSPNLAKSPTKKTLGSVSNYGNLMQHCKTSSLQQTNSNQTAARGQAPALQGSESLNAFHTNWEHGTLSRR